MPRIRIPENLGECEVIIAKAGNYAVWNRKSGKNKFLVACKNREQADEVLKKIKNNDHDGELWL